LLFDSTTSPLSVHGDGNKLTRSNQNNFLKIHKHTILSRSMSTMFQTFVIWLKSKYYKLGCDNNQINPNACDYELLLWL